MKILAVDTDSFLPEQLKMVAAQGEVTDFSIALSGNIAIELLRGSDVVFDCLLLGIKQPGIDGLELCNIIRTMPGYQKTPIIMLAEVAQENLVHLSFRAGATDYINKPFDTCELQARLRTVKELVLARENAMLSGAKVKNGESNAVGLHSFQQSDGIYIPGVDDLVRYATLKKYLVQLSPAGIASSQVVAIKVDRIEAIARGSEEEFLYALTETAGAIGATFRPYSAIMSYAGNGTFLVISGKATMESSVGCEMEIQTQLDERNIEYDNGDPLDIEISIGNPIRPSTSKTQRVRKTFDRAIARAERRVLKKYAKPKPPNCNIRRLVDYAPSSGSGGPSKTSASACALERRDWR